jgi:hypothetical protein
MSLFKLCIYIVHNLNISVSYLDCTVQLPFFSHDIAHTKVVCRGLSPFESLDKDSRHPLEEERRPKIVYKLIFEKSSRGIINLNYHRNKLSFNLTTFLSHCAHRFRSHIVRRHVSRAEV